MIRRWLIPCVAAALFALPLAATAQEAYTTRTANVRAGPDTSYPVVAQLAPGYPLQVMGCLDDYRWCDVAFADNRGWVYSGSLVYPWQSRRVPILGYGATIGLPIITFSLLNYWDRYYRGRPFYDRRDYWERRAVPYRPRPYSDRPRYDNGGRAIGDRPGRPRPDFGNRPGRPDFENRPGRPDAGNRPNRPGQGIPGGDRPRPGGQDGRPGGRPDGGGGGPRSGGLGPPRPEAARPAGPGAGPARGAPEQARPAGPARGGGGPQPRESSRGGGEGRPQQQ